MTNPSTNNLGDSSLNLRAGRVVYGLPSRKLYCVVPYGKLTTKPVYCTVAGTSSVEGLSSSCSMSYTAGDDVLYVSRSEADSAAGMLYGVIISRAPIGILGKDTGLLSPTLTNLLKTYSEDAENSVENPVSVAIEKLTKSLQLEKEIGDKGFLDSSDSSDIPGGFDVGALLAHLKVDATEISAVAGRSKVTLNGVYDMLDIVSPLFRVNTSGNEDRLQLINDEFFHSSKKALSTLGKRGKINSAEFRYIEELSNYIYGHKEVLLSPDGLDIVSIDKSLDGKLTMSGANGVSLVKTIRTAMAKDPLPAPLNVYPDGAIKNKEDIDKVKDDKKIWNNNPTTPDKEPDNLLPLPKVGEGYTTATKDKLGNFSDGLSDDENAVKYSKILSYLDLLPSGGIVIRDAWGSEIRMEGGNIQISAANNLTTIAGRDSLDVCSGVHAINAGKAIQLGSDAESIDIKSANGVNICSDKGSVKLTAKDIACFSEGVNVDCDNTVIVKSKGILAGGGGIVLNGTTVTVHGSSSLALSSTKSALTLSATACLGASSFLVNSNLHVRKTSAKPIEVPDVNGSVSKSTPPTTAGQLTVSGNIQTESGIAATSQITSNTAVIAARVSCKGGFLGVGTIYSSPRAVTLNNMSSPAHTPSISATAIKTLIDKYKKIKDKVIFGLASKAFCIWQPLFSKKSGTTKITVVKHDDEHYIYPGKAFWEKEGMLLYDRELEQAVGKESSYKKQGASSLMLNSDNVEELK